VESRPLGTGGALRNALDFVESDDVLVMNGDSYTDADIRKFVIDYRESKADASMVVVTADERKDCGSVIVDRNGRVEQFEEKHNPQGARYFNAGIYAMSRRLLCKISPGLQVSLERELFPQWLREGKYVTAFLCPGRCVDIGTPERYRFAQSVLAMVEIEDTTPRQESQSCE
jgi:mannose-1-phosphate guanylyltransferase